MSAILNLPDIRPSLLLDFANSGRVDPRIQSTRASSATCYGPNGAIRTVGANVPRIDFDPPTDQCKGLLIEGQRTNLLKYSEQFDNAAWTKSNMTVTANAVVAPNGIIGADKMVESATNTSHFCEQTLSSLPAGTYSYSVFAKAGERSVLRVRSFAQSPAFAEFNLSNGSVMTSSGLQGTPVISHFGGGWYRCTITFSCSATTVAYLSLFLISGDITYPGDGTSGIYVWGAQLEESPFPTSYIPTAESQVTRATDAIQMPLGDWFNPHEGTVIVEYDFSTTVVNAGVIAFSDGADNNRMIIRQSPGGTTTFIGVKGGVTQYNNGFLSATPDAPIRAGFTYKKNRIAISRNGSAPLLDTEAEIPAVSFLNIGREATSFPLNGHIRRLVYYPIPLSDAQLQRLTAL